MTEKATNRLDTFRVNCRGYASAPRVHASAGVTPFGFDFTSDGAFVVTEAAEGITGQATAFVLSRRWADRAAHDQRRRAGLPRYRIARDGSITLHESIAAVTTLDQLSIRDAGLSEDGRYLYAIDIASQKVHAWEVDQHDGSLTPIGAFPGLPGTVAGLAAS